MHTSSNAATIFIKNTQNFNIITLKLKDIFQYVGSAAILIDFHRGDILSMISLPVFDLNKRETINDVNYINITK